MRKLLTLLALSCALIISCKKSEVESIEKPKYDVKFTVDDFTQTTAPMSSDGAIKTLAIGDTLKNYADFLNYRIYNSNGILVNSINQSNTSSTFGTITDKLPSGTYNVSLIAAKGAITSSEVSSTFINAVYNSFTNATWNDTFARTFSITVGTSAVNEAIRLTRIIGGLEVTVEDAIPSNAKKITLVVQSDAYFMQLSTNTPQSLGTTVSKDFQLQTSDVGVKGKKFLMYIANTAQATSVIIRAYDTNNSLINEKTVTNVRCYKNQKTSLSGALFPSTQNQNAAFTVTVNPTWDTPTNPVIPYSVK